MPLTKDSVEVATADSAAARPGATAAAKPNAAAGTNANAGAPQVRADAVSTEVPVRVYGSRIINVPGQLEPNTEPFEEQTSTMIVFPQGAVLRMSTTVAVGQMLVVTNTGTKADAICRVVKVRTFSNTQGYVEVEFTTAQPNYWGVRFPSDAPVPAPAQAAAPAAPAASVAPPAPQQTKPAATPTQPKPVAVAPPAPVAAKPAAPQASAPVAAPPTPVAAKPAAPAVQAPVAPVPVAQAPAAPVTKAPVAVAPPAPVAKVEAPAPVAASPAPQSAELDDDDVETLLNRLAPVAPVEIPSAPPAANVPSLSLSDLRGDAIVEAPLAGDDTESIDTAALAGSSASVAATAPVAEAPRRTFGSFSGGASLTGGSSLSSADEALAESAVSASAHAESSATIGGDYAEPQKKSSFGLIAACIAVLALVVAGGIFYFRASAAGSKAAAPFASDSKSSDAEPVNQPSDRTGLENSAGSSNPANKYSGVPATTASAAPATPVVIPSSAAPSRPTASESNSIQVVEGRSAAKAKALANAVDATTNAHPVASQRTDAGAPGAAPSIDGGSANGNGNELNGLVAGNDGSSLRAPELKVEGPVHIGGNVKEPQVLSHVAPVYPLAAKETGIYGDVVIQTTVDQKGNVVNAKVVSGPVMLRQPALDALKRWRYAPSTLNGQPISVAMLVTIKFSK
jgi:TonB family protein